MYLRIDKDQCIVKNKLKIGYKLKENMSSEMTLLEKVTTVKKVSAIEDCDPRCVHGICRESLCFCKIGWMGINCSIRISS